MDAPRDIADDELDHEPRRVVRYVAAPWLLLAQLQKVLDDMNISAADILWSRFR